MRNPWFSAAIRKVLKAHQVQFFLIQFAAKMQIILWILKSGKTLFVPNKNKKKTPRASKIIGFDLYLRQLLLLLST